ncbi:MAG TPA: signal peptidase I, partial [Candidatus Woesearchaeota archaeon]|nr:signal peptidase I [Candidatus Woesearchaeota archaeon]
DKLDSKTNEEFDKEIKADVKSCKGPKCILKRFWHFVWDEESLASYTVFILLAFVLLRFIIFPGFLFVSGFSDVAAVVSTSMHHGESIEYTFDNWLKFNNYSDEEVSLWPYQNGLDVGDVIAVKQFPPDKIYVGDIVLFYSPKGQIIHRVVEIRENNGNFYYTTKGDANGDIGDLERELSYDMIKGKLIGKVPYLGYPKVFVTHLWPF